MPLPVPLPTLVPPLAGPRMAMRGLAEGGSSAPASCTRPGPVPLTSSHPHPPGGLQWLCSATTTTWTSGACFTPEAPRAAPGLAGWVTATRSSEGRSGKASDLTGRQPCNSFTNNQPTPSWWLGAGRLFTPTRYTLRHSNHPGNVEHRLQSWRLEGSVDGADGSWRTLDEHTEPNALAARFLVMTGAAPPGSVMA
ncbi:hypothetical protein PAPYR_4463 [Paratrimastix pyriformis]|uniref:F5/8 type C domain-containing protein n=1 Tax=Paratrimastix pyriformis TaxID=342808 RepID=A0ABQ8URR2_9EUKA|nr:hypothetical protein PAPYR_4463 [Paratrimastix pyriformis]